MSIRTARFSHMLRFFGVFFALLFFLSITPANAAIYARVRTTSTRMYPSLRNARRYLTLRQGSFVQVLKAGKSWVWVRIGKRSGFIPRKTLVQVKAARTTRTAARSSLRTLRAGNSGAAVKLLQTRLYALGYLGKASVNGKYGSTTIRAVRKFQLINGFLSSGTATLSTQRKLYSSGAIRRPGISIASWAKSGINSRFRIHGGLATIVDAKTGVRIRIRRLYGDSHCDVEPATKADTAKLKAIYGGKWSWDSRGVLLIAGGKVYAAAINSFPHGGQISRSNAYPGQFCLHLKDSKTHGSGKENSEHQNNIERVYQYFRS